MTASLPKPQAIFGRVIVKFDGYRRDGTIIIPDKHKPEPVEATVIDDSTGELEEGDKVCVSRMDGTYFEHGDDRLCVVSKSSILFKYED